MFGGDEHSLEVQFGVQEEVEVYLTDNGFEEHLIAGDMLAEERNLIGKLFLLDEEENS